MRTANWAALCVAMALIVGCQAASRTGSSAPYPSEAPATSAPASLTSERVESSLASGPVTSPFASSPVASPQAFVASITPSAAAAAAAPAAAKACTSSQLAVTLGERQQVMAQPAIAVIFTNASSTPCTLYGYPGVAGLDSSGREIVQAYRTPQVYLGGAPTGVPTKVTLESGTQASALISGGANPINGETACPPDYAAVLVTAPGGAKSTNLPLAFPSCTGLAVTPVVSGATGGFFSPLASP